MFRDNPKINEAVATLRGMMVEEASKVVGPLDLDFTLGGDAGINVRVSVDMVNQAVRFDVEKFLTDKHDLKRHVRFFVNLNSVPTVPVGGEPTAAELLIPQLGTGPFRDYDADKAAQAEL